MSSEPTKSYVPGLDGLRAVCVTIVILSHLGFGRLIPGGLGVTIFFFISGFLITRLLWGERDQNGGVDLWRFYGRRMLRLLPELAAFLLILGVVVGPLLHQPLGVLQTIAALTYWTNYYIISGLGSCDHCAMTGQLWSLAVEEHFYLVMPVALLACAFAPKRLAALFLAVIVAASAWRAYATIGLHLPDIYTYEATECRIDSIAWGCLAALIERAWPSAMALIRRRTWTVLATGLMVLAGSLAWRDETFRATLRYSVQGLALVAVVLALVTGPRAAALVKGLEIAPLRWMGRRSYAAYLWHVTALSIGGLIVGFHGAPEAASRMQQLEAMPIVLALTWLFAELSYRFVFSPAQRLKPLLTATRTRERGGQRGAFSPISTPTATSALPEWSASR